MITICIPGRTILSVTHVVLDMNGTIALDGKPLEGVAERLAQLSTLARLVMLTADTHGGASRLGDELGIETIVLHEGSEAEQKRDLVEKLGAEHVIAIGNGSNDALMLETSAIGICVVGGEGASLAALLGADVLTDNILDALDLMLKPQRLVATLRA